MLQRNTKLFDDAVTLLREVRALGALIVVCSTSEPCGVACLWTSQSTNELEEEERDDSRTRSLYGARVHM
jgi:hypothetical protein